jgi:hypothetical protein
MPASVKSKIAWQSFDFLPLGYDPVVIVSEANDGTVGFAATERGIASGVTSGKINRITGLASIDFKTNDGVETFDGACKRAEKLF